MQIAHNLKRLRERADLGQTELAGLMKAKRVSAEFISMIESGKRKPSVATLEEFARVLGCTVSDLVREQTAPRRRKRSA